MSVGSAADAVDTERARCVAVCGAHAVRGRLVGRRAEAVETEVVLHVEALTFISGSAWDAAASVATDGSRRAHRCRSAAGAGTVIEAAATFRAVVASAALGVDGALGVAARIAADSARAAIRVRGALACRRRDLATEAVGAGAGARTWVVHSAARCAVLVHADSACAAFAGELACIGGRAALTVDALKPTGARRGRAASRVHRGDARAVDARLAGGAVHRRGASRDARSAATDHTIAWAFGARGAGTNRVGDALARRRAVACVAACGCGALCIGGAHLCAAKRGALGASCGALVVATARLAAGRIEATTAEAIAGIAGRFVAVVALLRATADRQCRQQRGRSSEHERQTGEPSRGENELGHGKTLPRANGGILFTASPRGERPACTRIRASGRKERIRGDPSIKRQAMRWYVHRRSHHGREPRLVRVTERGTTK